MSRLYGEQHRVLQDQFQTRKMADWVEGIAVQTEIGDDAKAFIESRDLFFLSTIDGRGQPSVSHKGGEVGFVKVIDKTTIAFPSYDGNGMFYSMGNITQNSKVGLLFIDFENPHRLRFHGEASVSATDSLLGSYNEAELIVRVKLVELFINCPRYIHRYQRLAPSRYVPRQGCQTPLAEWKKIDSAQDTLPPKDSGRAEKEGGVITPEQYFEKLAKGEA